MKSQIRKTLVMAAMAAVTLVNAGVVWAGDGRHYRDHRGYGHPQHHDYRHHGPKYHYRKHHHKPPKYYKNYKHRDDNDEDLLIGLLVGGLVGYAISHSQQQAQSYDQGYYPPAAGQPQQAPLPATQYGYRDSNGTCLQEREYQTKVIVGGKEVDAYGTACLQPDGSWRRGPAQAVSY
jgi:hypothetical protein